MNFASGSVTNSFLYGGSVMIVPTTKAELLEMLEERLPDNLVLESMDLDVSKIVSVNFNSRILNVREGIHIEYTYTQPFDD